jgi:hypothetical protein
MKKLSDWLVFWQKKETKQLASFGIKMETSESAPVMIPSSGILHHSCKTLSLASFINIYCNGKFNELGTGTQDELELAWVEIVSEWSDLMKNSDTDYLISVKSQILELRKHISWVENADFLLRRRYDKGIVERLINEGYPGEYPSNNQEELNKQLDMVVSLCKTNIFKLWELVDEENRIEKDNMGGKSTEEDFVKNIMRLSKYQGYRINKFEITVFEYAAIHNSFMDEIKHSSAKQTT